MNRRRAMRKEPELSSPAYRLTSQMRQNFRNYLVKFHDLLKGGRCSGWQLEEFLVKSIRSDNVAGHHAKWREGGHDTDADITVLSNRQIHLIQVKSGKLTEYYLKLSGHRLGRFNGDVSEITQFLNNTRYQIISVAYSLKEDDRGRAHCYTIHYIDPEKMRIGADLEWKEVLNKSRTKVSRYQLVNEYGVKFSLHPSMSWQIWWDIPLNVIDSEDEFCV